MYRSIPPSEIRPKITNLPRQQSEATSCLEVYKLVVERKRLQSELEKLNQRRTVVLKRLEVLNQQVADLEQHIQVARQPSVKRPPVTRPAQTLSQAAKKQDFNTFTLEY